MHDSLFSRLESTALLAWTVATAALLLGSTASSLRYPALPVVFGLIHAHGSVAVWATLLPGFCGVAGAVALLQKRPVAAVLLLGYSAYWCLLLGGGLALAAYHTTNMALTQLPWWNWVIGGTVFLTMLATFLMMALWSLDHLRRDGPAFRDS
jgi:hypothetical protein